MSKIKIRTNLKTKDEFIVNNLKGIKEDNLITFIENGIKTKIYIDNNTLKIVRKTTEYEMILKFEKFLTITGKYDIKDIGILDLKTKTEKLKISKNKICIEYLLYINNENLGLNIYEIEYEAI